ncbi:MAG TPA: metallophosphoesterase [Chloroflexota bacterium]|nr:metallophosphoesterase [Chloroflexota bacterium]
MRQLLFGLAGLGAGALFYATRIEPRWLEIRDLTLRLPCWPRRLDGLTVLHLSDLHAKPGEQWQHDLIRQAAAVEADLVCLTGDYGDRPRWAPIAIDAVRGARGRLGTFAVLGNHDFDARVRDGERPARFSPSVAARVGYHMEAQGITVLRNEAVRLCVNGTPLWIVGVDDPHTFHDDAWRAYEGVPPDEQSIFLAHSWEPTPVAAERGARLALAGHSHAGQVRPPFLPPPYHNCYRAPPKAGGLSWVGSTALHVSQGLGGTVALRFLVRPQAVRLTLRSR